MYHKKKKKLLCEGLKEGSPLPTFVLHSADLKVLTIFISKCVTCPFQHKAKAMKCERVAGSATDQPAHSASMPDLKNRQRIVLEVNNALN